MEKAGRKTRDIRFYSEKNKTMVCVHNQKARDYAKYLESSSWVEKYETGRRLDMRRYVHVSSVRIRKAYFDTEWASDFFISCTDGRQEVHELSTQDELRKKSEIEKLEFSRRYWNLLDISRWALVI